MEIQTKWGKYKYTVASHKLLKHLVRCNTVDEKDYETVSREQVKQLQLEQLAHKALKHEACKT